MYSFEEEPHLESSPSRLNAPNDSGFSTPFSTRLPHQTSTPSNSQNILRRKEANNFALSDLLERQNGLMLQLLEEQKRLASCIPDLKKEIKETKDTVEKLVAAQETTEKCHQDKMKRKYPFSLTVSLTVALLINFSTRFRTGWLNCIRSRRRNLMDL